MVIFKFDQHDVIFVIGGKTENDEFTKNVEYYAKCKKILS